MKPALFFPLCSTFQRSLCSISICTLYSISNNIPPHFTYTGIRVCTCTILTKLTTYTHMHTHTHVVHSNNNKSGIFKTYHHSVEIQTLSLSDSDIHSFLIRKEIIVCFYMFHSHTEHFLCVIK